MNKRAQWWGELLAVLTVVSAVLGMAMSSPPLVGPDEPAHQATAYYTSVHILPPTSETSDYTPGVFKQGACMAYNSAQDASCILPRDDVWPAKVRVLNYPPPYYWVVGLGQKLAPGADDWTDVGGRLASMALNLAGLLVLAALCRRICGSWGTYLLLVTTPIAAFLWAVVNPNGWEITSGLLFAFLFATAWWGMDPGLARAASGWLQTVLVALASVTFALSRHDGIVWMVLLVLAAALMGRAVVSRKDQLRLLAGVAVGLIAGLAWQVTHPAVHDFDNPDRVADPGITDYLHWLGQIDDYLPERVRQMVGVLGWLDTPVPNSLVILMLCAWAGLIGFLYARTRIPPLALLVGFAGAFIVPSGLEVLRWNDWPYWYQGRITLAFVLPFVLLILVRFGSGGRHAAVAVSLLNAGVLAFMVWQNLVRYAFGVTDYLPLRWSDPAIGTVWFWGTALSILVIVLATGIRTWLLVRERRQVPPVLESHEATIN